MNFTNVFLIRVSVLVACILAVPNSISAQTNAIDSLRVLSRHLEGAAKADVLNELSLQLTSIDAVESRSIAKRSYDLSVSMRYEKGIAQALLIEARFDCFAGKNDTAIFLLKRCVRLVRDTKESELAG